MIKKIVKRLPHPLFMRLFHRLKLRERRAVASGIARVTGLPLLEKAELTKWKTSDTIFILGSGWSINEISPSRWEAISRHDTIAMNFWPLHTFVPRIYLFENVSRQEPYEFMFDRFRDVLKRRAEDYKETLKIVSELSPLGPRQLVSEVADELRPNLYIGYSGQVPARTQTELVNGLRYLRNRSIFSSGHRMAWHFKYGSSVTAAMSIAMRMNYRRIVLCGIDLAKADYFYHNPERYPEACQWEFSPRKAAHLMMNNFEWLVPAKQAICSFKSELLDPAGIEIFVENRSSALYPDIDEVTEDILGSGNAGEHARPVPR